MIEEQAIVTRIHGGKVWIKSTQSSSCGGCMQRASCSTATLAKLLPNREFAVECDTVLQVGDLVCVAIDDAHFLLSSLLLYLAPLLPTMIGVGLVDAFMPPAIANAWLPEIALALLLLAFWLIHHFQTFLLPWLCFNPKIARKLSNV